MASRKPARRKMKDQNELRQRSCLMKRSLACQYAFRPAGPLAVKPINQPIKESKRILYSDACICVFIIIIIFFFCVTGATPHINLTNQGDKMSEASGPNSSTIINNLHKSFIIRYGCALDHVLLRGVGPSRHASGAEPIDSRCFVIRTLERTHHEPYGKDNIMYSAYLRTLVLLYNSIFNDNLYAKPRALLLEYKPYF